MNKSNKDYLFVFTYDKTELLNAGYTFNYSILTNGREIYSFYNDGDEALLSKDLLLFYKNTLFL